MKAVTRLLVLTMALLPATAWAADTAKGEEKAFLCVSCHGADGIGIGPLWPNLAGQKAGYLAKQMKDFRAGKRSGLMMEPLMKNLSDEDIDNLAAFYSEMGADKAVAPKNP